MSKLRRFTVSPSGASEASPPTAVVVVPPTGRLDHGFMRARRILDGVDPSVSVRVVGVGATLEHVWPSWARSEPRLSTTELGAYRAESRVTGGKPFRLAIEQWLDEAFAGAVPGLRGAEVFYASAMARFLERHHDSYGLVVSLAEHHATAEIHCTDPEWQLLDVLHALIEPNGGRVVRERSERSERAWRIRFGALWLAGQAASLARLVASFVRSAEGRRTLAEAPNLGAQVPAGDDSPEVWTVLAADWLRVNKHVVTGVALPELLGRKRLGVLLFGSIAKGARAESAAGKRTGGELWPGLGEIRKHLDRCVVEQVCQPMSWGDVGRVAVRSTLRSARVAIRVVSGEHVLGPPEYTVRASRHCEELAKLATIDVLRATVAELATKDSVARRDWRGKVVFFAAAEFADLVVVDRLLQRAGATTFAFRHGSITDDWAGSARTRASYTGVWTGADAASIAELGERAFIAGSPFSGTPTTRSPQGPRRILVLTNFTHWGSRVDGWSPLECFQDEMLRAADRIQAVRGSSVEFRWRPHPADDPEAVNRGLRGRPYLTRSTSETCQEDVAWADVVLASISTSVVEALLGGGVVFVHLPPDHLDVTPTSFIEPTRRFFWARDVVGPVCECLTAIDAGLDVTAPERAALTKLFGSAAPSAAGQGTIVDRARALKSQDDVREPRRAGA